MQSLLLIPLIPVWAFPLEIWISKEQPQVFIQEKKRHQQQHKQMQLALVILIFVFIFINDSIISFGELQDSWNIKIVNKCPFLCKHFLSAVGVELVEHTGSH